jgi:hypothetical protein
LNAVINACTNPTENTGVESYANAFAKDKNKLRRVETAVSLPGEDWCAVPSCQPTFNARRGSDCGESVVRHPRPNAFAGQ